MTAMIAPDIDGDLPAPNDWARVDPRTVPVRFSRLKAMAASPLHYWYAVQEDRDDSLAMRLGRGVHAMVLGMPVVKFTGKQRRGAAWESFQAENGNAEILNEREWSESQGMADAIRLHPIASRLLYGAGAVVEQTIEWELDGRACTARPDVRYGHDVLIDLKSTRCAEPGKFARDAKFMGYHAQFSFYGRAMRHALGGWPDERYVIAVESEPPYPVTVLQLTQRAIDEGEKCWRLWFERLRVCEAANHWPAYTDAIEKFDVEDDDAFRLTVGGEEIDF